MVENKEFRQGEIIFKEGNWSLSMFDIISGTVGIYANYGQDGEKLLTELGAGKFFGEMGLVDAMPRSATAVAISDCTLAEITVEDFEDYFKESPEKIISIIQNMSQRLRSLSTDYLDACNTISVYINEKTPKEEKKGIWNKIKKLLVVNEETARIYAEIAAKDPCNLSYYYTILY